MNRELQALVIDDEQPVRDFVTAVLQADGWRVTQSASAEEAFDKSQSGKWEVVFCDVLLGGANGFDVLRRFKQDMPETRVVLMTGHGSAVGALDATAFGAYDYLLKPFGVDELLLLLRTISERQSGGARGRVINKRPAAGSYASDIDLVGRSEAFIQVMKQVGRVAATPLPVLITGESGTGKEIVARAPQRGRGRT